MIAPAVVPLPPLTAQVVAAVAPETAQPPRMEVPVLAVVVEVKPRALGEVPSRTAKPVPAGRVIAPRVIWAYGVVPVVIKLAAPANVSEVKFWTLYELEPSKVKVALPMVSALTGKILAVRPLGTPESENQSRRLPSLIVVEPVNNCLSKKLMRPLPNLTILMAPPPVFWMTPLNIDVSPVALVPGPPMNRLTAEAEVLSTLPKPAKPLSTWVVPFRSSFAPVEMMVAR